MTKSFLKKAVTLICSLSLVVFFLLYRVGIFEKLSSGNEPALQSSHNGGNINPTTIDTTKLKKDSTNHLMLSSSKVIILTDKTPSFIDTVKKKPKKNKYPKGETEMLSSSKSAIIFKPVQTDHPNPDSFKLKTDTLKPKKKKE